MTGKVFKSVLLAVSAAAMLSFDVPKGWHTSGSAPAKYDMGMEFGAGRNSKYAGTIQSLYRHINGFGTLMQNVSADKYKGKRIRMSGYMRTADVRRWAGFWLRVDQEGTGKTIAFDNMHERPVSGNTNWRRYDIVLDVPNDAEYIAFGALLSGTGRIWFDDIKVEEVPAGTPTTGRGNKYVNMSPENLTFED